MSLQTVSWKAERLDNVVGDSSLRRFHLKKAPPNVTDAPMQAQPKAGDVAAAGPGSGYKGEGLAKAIEPSSHYTAAGDTPESIAGQKLGKDAAKDEVEKYAREISAVNGLKQGESLAEGRQLKLPGHTADGGFMTTDERGFRHTTVWPDGREKYEDKVTGKWVVKKPGRDGSMQEKHGGSKRPEENFVLVTEKNGRYRLAEYLDEQPWECQRPMI